VATEASGTGSIHTVWQMPLTEVYQMPEGSRVCLPRGCVPESVGSVTETTSSWSPAPSSGVTSKEKGV
jgi:hypothetical protein